MSETLAGRCQSPNDDAIFHLCKFFLLVFVPFHPHPSLVLGAGHIWLYLSCFFFLRSIFFQLRVPFVAFSAKASSRRSFHLSCHDSASPRHRVRSVAYKQALAKLLIKSSPPLSPILCFSPTLLMSGSRASPPFFPCV